MPTNEERREVVQRLKNWTWKSSPSECILNALVFGDGCPGTDDDPDTIDCHQCECFAAKRLAELIEPEPQCTCKREKFYDAGRVWYSGCSKCRHPLNVLDSYCPNCGAKVVDE